MRPLAPVIGLAALLAACGGAPAPRDERETPGTTPAGSPSASPEARGSTQAPPGWQVLDDAPFARLEMAVAAHDGRIWPAGGLSPTGAALTEVDVFDPASGTWSEGPDLPAGVHHAALVSDGERLLLIGGYIGPDFNRLTDLVLVLADGDTQWREGPGLPNPRAAGAAAFDGTRVVYAGGFATDDLTADVYALEEETWERVGRMAIAKDHLAATSDGAGTVWLMGGRIGALASNLADVEVVTADGVRQVAQLPTRRGGVAAFFAEAVGACLTGGESPTEAFTTVECVSADGDVTSLPPLNQPHHGHGAAVVDGVAYVLLGGPEPTLSASSVIEALPLEP